MKVEDLRRDFAILNPGKGGVPPIYLDNAATTQRPNQVIEAIGDFYRHHNANPHRGVYALADDATTLYEEAHKHTARFIHADSYREVIFLRNTTEAINLAAAVLGESIIREGDAIVATVADHHANMLPWHYLAESRNGSFHLLTLTPDGLLDEEAFMRLLEKRPRVVALPHVSNVLGMVNDIKRLTALAHEAGALVVVDGGLSTPHLPVDVKDLGVDFFAFSAHKMLGPMGVGVLYGREELLTSLPPYMRGGDMIDDVVYDSATGRITPTWNVPPWKYEAGTSNVGGAVGFDAALTYLERVGWEPIREHSAALEAHLREGMEAIEGCRPLVTSSRSVETIGNVAFTVEGLTGDEVAAFLDSRGICVRSGRHCAHPLHAYLGIAESVRISAYIYNTIEEVDRCLQALTEMTTS